MARLESPDSFQPEGAIAIRTARGLVVTTDHGPAVHIRDLRTIRARIWRRWA